MSGLIGLGLVGAALAAIPVYTLGEPDDAVARVAAATRTHPLDLAGRSLGDALAALPPTLEGGELQPCEGETRTLAELQTLQVQLQGAVNYVRLDEGAAALAQADAVLGCLGEPVDTDLAARVGFLAGVIHHQRGAPEAADAAFRLALAFEPGLVWDPRISPRLGQERFDGVRAGVGLTATVTLSPPPSSLGLRIDGVAVPVGTETLALGPGRHLVQREGAGVASSWLALDGSSGTLILPVQDPDPTWLDTDAGRTFVAGLLALVEPPGTPIYLVGDAIWAGAVGEDGWKRVLPPDAPAVKGLRLGGAALGGVGALAAGGVWVKGWTLRRRCTNEVGPERYGTCEQAAAADQRLGTVAWPATLALAGAGVAAGLVGVGLRRLVVAPVPVPGGALLGLTWIPGGAP